MTPSAQRAKEVKNITVFCVPKRKELRKMFKIQ
jgi:hypothetical protein